MNTLAEMILGNALLATLLACVAWLAGRLCRQRPALVHLLWMLVLVKLVTPPLLPLPALWPTAVADVGEPAELAEPADPFCPACVFVVPEEGPAEAAGFPDWKTALLVLWLAGAGMFWTVALWRVARLERVLAALPPAEGEITERVRRCAEQLGLRQPPAVWLVGGLLSPLVLALGRRARLIFPTALWHRLDEEQRDTLLLHELAHLVRGDHHLRVFELFVLGLYWWHPAAWWACRQLHVLGEQCCDALVVQAAPGSAGAYASALVETVAFLSGAPALLPPTASGAAPVFEIRRRLEMILNYPPRPVLSRWALALVLALACAVLPLMPPLAGGQTPSPQEPARLPPRNVSVDAISRLSSCQSCHTAYQRNKPAKADEHLHAEIVKLMNDAEAQRKRWQMAEERLTEALQRFEKQHGKRPPAKNEAQPAGDKRIELLEKKLEELRKEIQEMRGKEKAKPRTNAIPSGVPSHVINLRRIMLPLRWSAVSKKEAVLYVSADGGASYEMVARAKEGEKEFTYEAPRDGDYLFSMVIVDRDEKTPKTPRGLQGQLAVTVDTAARP